MTKQEIVKAIRNASNGNKMIKCLYHFAHKIKVRKRLNMSDEEFAQDYYRDKTGLRLNLENPQTFDEKLWWIKLHYHNPLMTICADKYAVRQYVIDIIGGGYLNELYASYDSVDDIDYNALPNEFFMKTNHGCGGSFWCHDKNTFDFKKACKSVATDMKQNYYVHSREWPYKDIKPRVIFEKVLKPTNPPQLIDYRFFCFNGVCHYVMVGLEMCSSTGEHNAKATLNVYDKDFNYLDVKDSRERFDPALVCKPSNFVEMRDVAEKLSKPFPFVRVDLYSFDNLIRLGEMTFFNMSGVNDFEPKDFQYTMGNLITLPDDEFVV